MLGGIVFITEGAVSLNTQLPISTSSPVGLYSSTQSLPVDGLGINSLMTTLLAIALTSAGRRNTERKIRAIIFLIKFIKRH